MPLGQALNNRKNRNRPDEILDAARALFFRNGYRATTIMQIAQRAGYSKRTVYLDYRNKDELFMTICAEGGRLLLEKLKSSPFQEMNIDEAVNHFMTVYIRFSRDQREYFRMIFSEATPEIMGNCSGELRTQLRDLERACLSVLVSWAERAMREGFIPPEVDPWEVAGILVGTATGIILLSMGGQPDGVFHGDAGGVGAQGHLDTLAGASHCRGPTVGEGDRS